MVSRLAGGLAHARYPLLRSKSCYQQRKENSAFCSVKASPRKPLLSKRHNTDEEVLSSKRAKAARIQVRAGMSGRPL